MKYGINTMLFSGRFNDENTNLFKKFKAWGFDGVEIALEDKKDINCERVLESLKENNLETSSICGLFSTERDIRGPNEKYIEIGMNYIKDCIEACSELECNLFTGPLYSAVGRANIETEENKKIQWHTVVNNLKEICKFAEEKGVFIALEPLNRYETDFLNICQDAVKLIDDVESDMLKIHLDTFHMSIEENNLPEAIKLASNLLYNYHASDNQRGAPGSGIVNWNEIAKALKDINYKKYVVIESFTPEIKEFAQGGAIWRKTAANGDQLASNGLAFLKNLFE